MVQTVRPGTASIRLSLEDDTEVKQTDAVVQSETGDELSAAVTQLDAADESLVIMTRRVVTTEPSMNEQASATTETNRERSAEMSGERLSGTTDSDAGRHVKMTEGLSVEAGSELSPLEPTELTELESMVRVQRGQLTELPSSAAVASKPPAGKPRDNYFAEHSSK